MRLKLSTDGELRVWQCCACTHSKEIPKKKTLSIAEIANSLKTNNHFSRSADIKRDQANIRRLITGLEKLELSPFMSVDESKAWEVTLDLLKRFGCATEVATINLKLEEGAQEKLVNQRFTQAKNAIAERYPLTDIFDQVTLMLAISAISDTNRSLFTIESLENLQASHSNWPSAIPLTRVVNVVHNIFEDVTHSLARETSYKPGAIDEVLETLFYRLDEKVIRINETHKPHLDSFRHWLEEVKKAEQKDGLARAV
jgi:hypothetical protein